MLPVKLTNDEDHDVGSGASGNAFILSSAVLATVLMFVLASMSLAMLTVVPNQHHAHHGSAAPINGSVPTTAHCTLGGSAA